MSARLARERSDQLHESRPIARAEQRIGARIDTRAIGDGVEDHPAALAHAAVRVVDVVEFEERQLLSREFAGVDPFGFELRGVLVIEEFHRSRVATGGRSARPTAEASPSHPEALDCGEGGGPLGCASRRAAFEPHRSRRRTTPSARRETACNHE